uniref:Uncharacterized protein n=1 Tax=Arundo donax TaxID=35708 RepID=A0A0A9F992_ARUDO
MHQEEKSMLVTIGPSSGFLLSLHVIQVFIDTQAEQMMILAGHI